MFKRLLVIMMLIPLLLAACNGAQSAVDEGATQAVAAPPQVTPTEAEPTPTTAAPRAAGPEMECTLVSSLPEAPAELVEIFGVKENDWVQGPDTAAVTFVEYSDFQ